MHLREDWRDHVFWPFESETARTGRRSVSPVLPAIGLLVLIAGVVVAAAHLGMLPAAGAESAMTLSP